MVDACNVKIKLVNMAWTVILVTCVTFYSWKCAEKHTTTFRVLQDALCLQYSLIFVSGHAYLILLENQSVGCAISPTPLQEDPLVVVSVHVVEWITNSRDTHHTA